MSVQLLEQSLQVDENYRNKNFILASFCDDLHPTQPFMWWKNLRLLGDKPSLLVVEDVDGVRVSGMAASRGSSG
jgi:hypothetical protein